jgi:hypothetical protein
VRGVVAGGIPEEAEEIRKDLLTLFCRIRV